MTPPITDQRSPDPTDTPPRTRLPPPTMKPPLRQGRRGLRGATLIAQRAPRKCTGTSRRRDHTLPGSLADGLLLLPWPSMEEATHRSDRRVIGYKGIGH